MKNKNIQIFQKYKFNIAFLLLFLLFYNSFGQTKPTTNIKAFEIEKRAKENFANGLYKLALDDYQALVKIDSSNIVYFYRLGICYANTFIDKAKAIYYLEKVSKQNIPDISFWYELARVYALNYQFDEAIETFQKYKTLLNGKDTYRISADRWIQMCQEAQGFIKKPANVSIENVGSEINSIYPDYNPYITADEGTIVFTSKRKGNSGALLSYDGFNTADIYTSNFKGEKWGKARNIGATINTDVDEESVGYSTDGNEIFINIGVLDGDFQVYSSSIKGKSFQQPSPLGINITSNYKISSCAISQNKKLLFFSAQSNKGIGGRDLYMSRKLPSGEWGQAENLGATINTIYDEDFPTLSPDGITLYFASTGHNSMGGYDIFKTIFDYKTSSWSEPINMGYPINTPDDDKVFSITSTGRHAYISSFRNDSYGDLDIYRVTFNSIEPSYTVLKVILMNKDSVQIFSPNLFGNEELDNENNAISKKFDKDISVTISIYDKKQQKIFGTYKPDRRNGSFVAILPPSEYKMTIESSAYQTFTDDFKINDFGTNTKEQKRKIVLIKKQTY